MLLGTEADQYLVVARSNQQTGWRRGHEKRIRMVDRPRASTTTRADRPSSASRKASLTCSVATSP